MLSDYGILGSFRAHSSFYKGPGNIVTFIFFSYYSASENHSIYFKNVAKRAMNYNLGSWDVQPSRVLHSCKVTTHYFLPCLAS